MAGMEHHKSITVPHIGAAYLPRLLNNQLIPWTMVSVCSGIRPGAGWGGGVATKTLKTGAALKFRYFRPFLILKY